MNGDKEWEDELQGRQFLGKKIDHPFNAPDGYFDSLGDSLNQRIHAIQPVKRGKVAVIRLLIPVAVAACIVVFLLLSRNKNQEEYIALDYDNLYNSGLVTFDENVLSEYLETGSDTSLTEEELYIIESLNEETLINEL